MGSRFPKVRRFAAEQLYVRALALDVSDLASAGLPASEEGLDQLQETLVSYAWVRHKLGNARHQPRPHLLIIKG